ncbi:MAG: type II toxin-antitoxin system HicA family toxin [Bacteroidota bacterium]|nr:type II toxin-antitoxin system HicA family toxin [Bacteroidota bacterium]
MMATIPVLKPKEVVKVFEKLGWEVARQRGSHIILTKPGSIASLSVPNHREVARGTLRSLISKADTNIDEFIKVLNE